MNSEVVYRRTLTVMTAGLVTAIWLIADDQLTSVLNRAISSVAVP